MTKIMRTKINSVRLCEDKSREWKIQSRYTPDAGEVHAAYCGVCCELMEVKRDVSGPRGFVHLRKIEKKDV